MVTAFVKESDTLNLPTPDRTDTNWNKRMWLTSKLAVTYLSPIEGDIFALLEETGSNVRVAFEAAGECGAFNIEALIASTLPTIDLEHLQEVMDVLLPGMSLIADTVRVLWEDDF